MCCCKCCYCCSPYWRLTPPPAFSALFAPHRQIQWQGWAAAAARAARGRSPERHTPTPTPTPTPVTGVDKAHTRSDLCAFSRLAIITSPVLNEVLLLRHILRGCAPLGRCRRSSPAASQFPNQRSTSIAPRLGSSGAALRTEVGGGTSCEESSAAILLPKKWRRAAKLQLVLSAGEAWAI